MTLSRRTLLFSLLPAALALAGCEDDPPLVRITATDAPAPTVGPSPSGRSASLRSEPPALSLPDGPVAQGGTFVASLTGDRIATATVEFNGRQFQTIQENGAYLAIIPVGQLIGSTEQVRPGTYPVAMHYELLGQPLPRTLEGSVTVTPTEFPVEYITFTPQVAALLEPSRVEQETAMLKAAYGGVSPVRLWEGFFLRPSVAEVSDVYGSRRSYQGGPVSGSHSGVDFNAPAGAPVYAAARGRVVLAQPLPVRGNTVILDHGAGVFTGYCHLSDFWVEPGQDVRSGEPIAATGATGLVTGPHLHWELVVGGQHVDGLRWLAL